MFLWHIVPSWQQIEDRIRREMGYQSGARYRNQWGEPVPSLSLNIRRVASVRSAFHQAEWKASDLLRQRFADLDISSILKDLIDVVTQMAMIVAGSTLTGGAIGAGVGAFFGGAGAVPMGAAGAAMGLQASSWILAILGLQSIAEFFVEGLPRIGSYYMTGIKTAWEGTRGDDGLTPFSQDDPLAIRSAAHNIALGHVEVVILLLGAIVEYLTRGRGNAGRLALEMRASPKGARIGQWVVEHEDVLKGRPDLQKAEPLRAPLASQKSPSTHSERRDKEPAKGKSNTMLLHEVECFKANKMPASKIGEFERQLQGQEKGLNRLTVDEYLKNIANPVKRNPAAAKKARKDLQDQLEERFLNDFPDLDVLEAEEAAIKKAKETMANLAGLHNPDLSAGGRDIIGDFGDRQVNSSIGPQWRPKIQNLKAAAEKVPESLRNSTFLNVKLHKC
ncbi:DUF6861 domain-containing protein [Pseudomonas sp.]|uniref:DUF6861 domain-containing protein n=1 Tax=Pseudomonas sp. TaxID=306 RepID=UPI0028A697D3|nr:polymorphic toxin type 15 domain-containing protein [Pseudomonas sp.]